MTPEEAATQFVSEKIAHRIEGDSGSFRIAVPDNAQVWDHAREDRFYREVNMLLPRGARASACRPEKGESKFMALIRWE